MKIKTVLMLCTPLVFSSVSIANAGWADMLNAVTQATPAVEQSSQTLNNVGQALQKGQQIVSTAQAVQSGDLTGLLMQRVGVTQAQAQGGAGALLQIAKSKMQAEAFSSLEQTVPGIPGILAAVPAIQQPSALGALAGSLSSMAGLSGGTVGSLVSAASAFQQLGMTPAMVQQFIPVVVDYVKTSGGAALSQALTTALIGL